MSSSLNLKIHLKVQVFQEEEQKTRLEVQPISLILHSASRTDKLASPAYPRTSKT